MVIVMTARSSPHSARPHPLDALLPAGLVPGSLAWERARCAALNSLDSNRAAVDTGKVKKKRKKKPATSADPCA